VTKLVENLKGQLWNPLKNLTYGRMMAGENMKPAGIVSEKYTER